MADDVQPEDEFVLPAMAGPIELEEAVPEVAFVVPAAAYDSIDTDDELARALASAPAAADREPDDRAARAVDALGQAIGLRLDALQTLFEREIRAEATREKIVDRLHAELQEYKQDLLLNILRPVFIDLIQLHDDIGKIADAQPEAEGEARRLLELMRGFQQGIEDILYRQGVEPFTEEADTFDPRRQRAIATVATDDAGRNKTIATRHRKGFRAGEKVIRAELVSVYAHKK